jgi:hypothetical protein
MSKTLTYLVQDEGGDVREWGYDTEGSGSGDLVGGLILLAIILGIVSQLAKKSECKQEERAKERAEKARVKKIESMQRNHIEWIESQKQKSDDEK